MASTLDRIDAHRVQRTSATGRRPDPPTTSKFEVTIEGLGKDYGVLNEPLPDRVGFSKISGIGSVVETLDIVQGTNPAVLQVPRSIKYDDVIFERGLANTPTGMALLTWYRDVGAFLFTKQSRDVARRAGVAAINGTILGIRRRRITIALPTYEIVLIDAWPIKGRFGDLNANESSVWIHSMTMKYSGIEVKSIAGGRVDLLEPNDEIANEQIGFVR